MQDLLTYDNPFKYLYKSIECYEEFRSGRVSHCQLKNKTRNTQPKSCKLWFIWWPYWGLLPGKATSQIVPWSFATRGKSESESEVAQSCPTRCDPIYGLQPTRLLRPWDFPGKNTGVGCHFLLQGIFLIQGWNPHLPHCRQFTVWAAREAQEVREKSPYRSFCCGGEKIVEHQKITANHKNKQQKKARISS